MTALNGIEKFNEWGLHFKRPAGEQVELPEDITVVSSEELGQLFTRLTAWTDYINSQLAVAQLEERALLKRREFEETSLLVKRVGSQVKGERITAIKAEVSLNPLLVELDEEIEEKYAYRKLVEMLLNNHERDLQLVSREITRRNSFRRDL